MLLYEANKLENAFDALDGNEVPITLVASQPSQERHIRMAKTPSKKSAKPPHETRVSRGENFARYIPQFSFPPLSCVGQGQYTELYFAQQV